MLLVGRTKIPYEQLFCLSRKELKALIKGHEIDQKDMIEAMRVQAVIGLQPHLKKGANLDQTKIWPLPWDKMAKHLESTPQDFAKAKKLLEIASKLQRNGKSKNTG
jgi:ribosomal protein S15P/S13E